MRRRSLKHNKRCVKASEHKKKETKQNQCKRKHRHCNLAQGAPSFYSRLFTVLDQSRTPSVSPTLVVRASEPRDARTKPPRTAPGPSSRNIAGAHCDCIHVRLSNHRTLCTTCVHHQRSRAKCDNRIAAMHTDRATHLRNKVALCNTSPVARRGSIFTDGGSCYIGYNWCDRRSQGHVGDGILHSLRSRRHQGAVEWCADVQVLGAACDSSLLGHISCMRDSCMVPAHNNLDRIKSKAGVVVVGLDHTHKDHNAVLPAPVLSR